MTINVTNLFCNTPGGRRGQVLAETLPARLGIGQPEDLVHREGGNYLVEAMLKPCSPFAEPGRRASEPSDAGGVNEGCRQLRLGLAGREATRGVFVQESRCTRENP